VDALDDQTLRVLLDRARAAVGATAGWIVGARDGGATVVVVSGDVGALGPGARVEGGSATYVMASGQPLAVAPRPGDTYVATGAVALIGRTPEALLSLPCLFGEDAVGALELAGKDGGGRFSLDDLELATSFADIAGPALASAGATTADVASPDQLAAELRRLERDDPDRYRQVAWAVGALLSGG